MIRRLTGTGDLLICGGKVFGGAGWRPPRWHEAALVRHGIVAAVGDYRDIEPHADGCREIDIAGAMLLPGLGDAHIHLFSGGWALTVPDLTGLDLPAIQSRLRQATAATDEKRDEWLEARSWESWRAPLDRTLLDSITPARPAVVYSVDLHSCCCNSRALQLAAIDAHTADPQGGVIVRSPDRQPNGVLKEVAIGLLDPVIPKTDPARTKSFILTAQRYLLSLGITAVSDAIGEEDEELYRRLDREGELLLDVDAWLRLGDHPPDHPPRPPGQRLMIKAVKLFLDGAFGSRTAALQQPYDDDPENAGLLFHTDQELTERLEPVVRMGWQLAFHAIGERAVAQACRLIQRLPAVRTGPHRIEHCQMLPRGAIQAIRRCGAVASIQPVHYLDDSRFLPRRIGPRRCRRTFIWRSLFRSGVPLALGSDWPVASPDPRLNIHAAVNRAPFGGSPHPDFDPAQALPPFAAVRAASYGWAYAAGVQDRRGAVVPGQAASFTVVAGLEPDLRDWSSAEVVMTICRGQVAYSR